MITTMFSEFIGNGDLRSITYLLPTISKNQLEPTRTIEDRRLSEIFKHSLICIGSPAANELTEVVIESSTFANKVCVFEFPSEESSNAPNQVILKSKFERDSSGNFIEEEILPPSGKGFTSSIILKIRNPGEKTFSFICAGVRGSGTAAAAYYFSKNWKTLAKEFDDREFCIFLESRVGRDHSAERIKSITPGENGEELQIF